MDKHLLTFCLFEMCNSADPPDPPTKTQVQKTVDQIGRFQIELFNKLIKQWVRSRYIICSKDCKELKVLKHMHLGHSLKPLSSVKVPRRCSGSRSPKWWAPQPKGGWQGLNSPWAASIYRQVHGVPGERKENLADSKTAWKRQTKAPWKEEKPWNHAGSKSTCVMESQRKLVTLFPSWRHDAQTLTWNDMNRITINHAS